MKPTDTMMGWLAMFLTCVLIGLLVAFAFVTCAHAEDREVSQVAKAILYLSPNQDMIYVDTLASLIESEFEDEGCDPVFGVVLCYKESSFNPRAYNDKSGCTGLFQIHPVHEEQCSFDIEVNVAAGAEIWSRYLERNDGDRFETLKRYGHRPSTARATLELFEEVQDAIE